MSRDNIIVLKSINYSEADKVLTVFGKRMGKFTLFANGIRKINSKNRGNMQTLNVCDISFYEGKGLPVLTESQLIYCANTDILKDRISDIKRVLDVLNKILQESDPNEKVFNILESVCKKNFDIESVNRFRIIFLKEMGYLGDFSSCSVCECKDGLEYIDLKTFALLCKNCYSKKRKGTKVRINPYIEKSFTEALDRYIKKVIEEI